MHKQEVVVFDQDEQLNFSLYMSYLKEINNFKNLLTLHTQQLKEEHFNIPTDWLIIDCPPAFNERTQLALKNADFVLIPVIPNLNSVAYLSKIRKIAGEHKDLIQFPIVKIGFNAPGIGTVAMKVHKAIMNMGFSASIIGELIHYKRITGNLYSDPRNWWSVGLSAVQREPFEFIYTELLHRYKQLLEMRKNSSDWKGETYDYDDDPK